MPLSIANIPIHHLSGVNSFHYLTSNSDDIPNLIILGDDHNQHNANCFSTKEIYNKIVKRHEDVLDHNGIFKYDQYHVLSTISPGWYKLIDMLGSYDKPIRYFIESFFDENLLLDKFYTSLPEKFENPLKKGSVHGLHYIPNNVFPCMDRSDRKCITDNIKYYFTDFRGERSSTKYDVSDETTLKSKNAEQHVFLYLSYTMFKLDMPHFTTDEYLNFYKLALEDNKEKEFAKYLFDKFYSLHTTDKINSKLIENFNNVSKEKKEFLFKLFIQYIELSCKLAKELICYLDYPCFKSNVSVGLEFFKDIKTLQNIKNVSQYNKEKEDLERKYKVVRDTIYPFNIYVFGCLSDLYPIFECFANKSSLCVYHCGYNHGIILSRFLSKVGLFNNVGEVTYKNKDSDKLFKLIGETVVPDNRLASSCISFDKINVSIQISDKSKLDLITKRVNLLTLNIFIYILEGHPISRNQLKQLLNITDESNLDDILSMIKPKIALF